MTTIVAGQPDSALNQRLSTVLGGRTATRLEKELGASTTGELLEHFPRRWVERGELTPIGLLPVDQQVTVVARVVAKSKRRMQSRRGFLVDVTVTDESTPSGQPVSADHTALVGTRLSMAFFNGYDADRRLHPGLRAMFHGKTALYRGTLTLNNPDFTILDDAEHPTDDDLAPIPVYPATAKLPTWTIRTCVDTVLDAINWESVTDPVPAELLADASDTLEPLPGLAEAYRNIHRPAQPSDAHRAKKRFALHEALILQGVLAARRTRNATAVASTPYPVRGNGILAELDARLPFSLTSGQRSAGETIGEGLAAAQPMSRLLQGEVGSGKTLVALRAMAQVVDGGGQAVLVAPTEVLAAQHHRSIMNTLGELGTAGQLSSWTGPATEVVLLTGSLPTAAKRQALLKMASGEAGIVVGTPALFSDNVSFAELGLVVVDEQHRFGVDQREALRQDNPGTHMLVMSATPIPRSVAMTVFGDLDITVLEGLPSGRQPVTTHVARMARGPRIIGRVWQIIAEQVGLGHQAFVVCPKITPADTVATAESNDTDDAPAELTAAEHAASVEDMVTRLPNIPVLQGLRFDALHGGQDQATQDAAMDRFNRGETDVLVATTVIEVGVDVPNATVMAILDADAFGLSTLHQLRGRVGRGTDAAACFLATRLPDEHPSLERLDVLAETQDGLRIAQADVVQRGEGDVLGSTQHGYGSRLKVLKVLRHADVIELCTTWLDRQLHQDPQLGQYCALADEISAWETAHEATSDYLEKT